VRGTNRSNSSRPERRRTGARQGIPSLVDLGPGYPPPGGHALDPASCVSQYDESPGPREDSEQAWRLVIIQNIPETTTMRETEIIRDASDLLQKIYHFETSSCEFLFFPRYVFIMIVDVFMNCHKKTITQLIDNPWSFSLRTRRDSRERDSHTKLETAFIIL